jgi:ribose 5-phosphate isomerase B
VRVAIASDHGGFDLKVQLARHLEGAGHSVLDLGPEERMRVDYPDYAALVARAVSEEECPLGVLVCGSGIGMSIAANKFPGVRAAVVQDVEHARLAREHNNANILCLGGRFTAADLASAILDAWLNTECSEERHHARIAKIATLE